MSDRGRKVLALSLTALSSSLVLVLGLWALGMLAPVGRSRGTPGPTLVAPPSDTRPGGPVTSAPPELPRPSMAVPAGPGPPSAPKRAPTLSLDVPASEPGSATSAAPPAKSGAAPGGGVPAPAPTTTPSTPSATLVKAEGRGTLKGQVVFDGDAPAAPPSQEPQPQRPQPQPRRDCTNSIGMKLARIEPGSFLMGSTEHQIDQLMSIESSAGEPFPVHVFSDEQPQHPVKITRPFFLGIHEVTQGQYQAVMGENPSHFKGSDDLPVEQVSWLDAVLFCNKLSEQEKRTPFYRINGTEVTIAGGNGYRLPTEAEWEYACRAGSTTLFPFGDDVSKLGDHAWYGCGNRGNSGGRTHLVGQQRPNAWGLYDMLGNVLEWCQDWYEVGYYAASPPADPPGPSQASDRVIRGGCWDTYSWYCHPADRGRMIRSGPGARGSLAGFRVAAVQE